MTQFPPGAVARLHRDLPADLREYGAIIVITGRPRDPSIHAPPGRPRGIVQFAHGHPVAGSPAIDMGVVTVADGGDLWLTFSTPRDAERFSSTLPKWGVALLPPALKIHYSK